MDCDGVGVKLGDASTGFDAVVLELGDTGAELESAEVDEAAGVSEGEGVGD